MGEEGDGLQAVGEVHEVLALSKRREADLGSATMKDKPSGLTVDIVIAFIIIITTTTTITTITACVCGADQHPPKAEARGTGREKGERKGYPMTEGACEHAHGS